MLVTDLLRVEAVVVGVRELGEADRALGQLAQAIELHAATSYVQLLQSVQVRISMAEVGEAWQMAMPSGCCAPSKKRPAIRSQEVAR